MSKCLVDEDPKKHGYLAIYDLYSIINHEDKFTSICLNQLDEKWYKYSNNECVQVGEEHVFSGKTEVLFYKRRI
jgi:hypothetical protein